jgi:hypothetical protein
MSLDALKKKYAEQHAKYKGFATDASKRADKCKAAEDMRAMERELANAGVTAECGVVIAEGARTKRSLQEQYVDNFDDEKPVVLGGKETTMRKYHKQRLGI